MVLSDVEIAGELFVRVVRGMSDDELRAPSALPNWSRAHVGAHVALNAEGFVAAATSLRAGEVGLMYPGGTDARDVDIDSLAAAPSDRLVARVIDANRAFLDTWDPAPAAAVCATAAGHPTFSSTTVPQRRLRELQVHLLDLDCAGVSVDDWTQGFVDADLRLQWPTVAHRTDREVTVIDEDGVAWSTQHRSADAASAEIRRRDLLAWVLDRAQPDGLPSLAPWSNRSKWEHLDTQQ